MEEPVSSHMGLPLSQDVWLNIAVSIDSRNVEDNRLSLLLSLQSISWKIEGYEKFSVVQESAIHVKIFSLAV